MRTITIVTDTGGGLEAMYLNGILYYCEETHVPADEIIAAAAGEPVRIVSEWSELFDGQDWPETLALLIEQRETAANAAGVVTPCFKTTDFDAVEREAVNHAE